MYSKTFKFLATAKWVTEFAEEQIREKTKATAATTFKGQTSSGSLKITAPNKAALDDAISLIQNNTLLKQHFMAT
jgi:hypothetical protein